MKVKAMSDNAADWLNIYWNVTKLNNTTEQFYLEWGAGKEGEIDRCMHCGLVMRPDAAEKDKNTFAFLSTGAVICGRCAHRYVMANMKVARYEVNGAPVVRYGVVSWLELGTFNSLTYMDGDRLTEVKIDSHVALNIVIRTFVWDEEVRGYVDVDDNERLPEVHERKMLRWVDQQLSDMLKETREGPTGELNETLQYMRTKQKCRPRGRHGIKDARTVDSVYAPRRLLSR